MAAFTNQDWNDGFLVLDANGAAVDLTGADLRLMVRANATDTATLLSLTVGAGTLVLTVPTEGKLETNVPKATMETIAPGTYPYDLVRVTGGVWDMRFGGFVTIRQGVTR